MGVLKKIAFSLSLIILLLPAIETFGKFFITNKLQGAYFPKNKPEFSDSAWFSNSFQKEAEDYLTDTFGFRNTLIRLYNQVDFDLYKKLHAYDIVIGKGNSLQATTHYDAYLGKLDIPHENFEELTFKLKRLQDTLQKLNKFLFFVIAPSKGCYALDKAPYWYNTKKKKKSFYEELTSRFKDKNIHYLDFNLLYKNAKEKKLFTDYGIHWARFSVVKSYDTLLRFIEHKSSYKNLPVLKEYHLKKIRSPHNNDIDLTPSLNLLKPFPFKKRFTECNFVFEKRSEEKVNMMVIADSFYWLLNSYRLAENTMNDVSFFYYYSTIYKKTLTTNIGNINLKNEIDSSNVIFIMATLTNLDKPGWGFINDAYRIYFK